MPANTDFTTLLSNHLVVLRAANAQNAKDVTTAIVKDIPTMEAVQAAARKDVNSDYYQYLQSHA